VYSSRRVILGHFNRGISNTQFSIPKQIAELEILTYLSICKASKLCLLQDKREKFSLCLVLQVLLPALRERDYSEHKDINMYSAGLQRYLPECELQDELIVFPPERRLDLHG
jgi:hypothetical protein